MASIYSLGTAGPWYVDDTLIALDGTIVNGEIVHQPTVDGIGGLLPRRRRFNSNRDLWLGRVVRHEDRGPDR